MKEIQDFTITLDDQRASFTGGEILMGAIHLTLKEPAEMQGIKIQFSGETYCRWNDTHASKNGNRKPKTDQLISLEKILFGFKEGVSIESVPVHPSGSHSYDFEFSLPKSLPCSFESPKDRDWGLTYIRYSLTATIMRPWKSNVTEKIPISINELIDTSLPEYTYRPGCQTQKELGSCLSDGMLSIEAYLDSVCYRQEGKILISAVAENESNRIMSSVYAKLYRRTRYYRKSDTKTYLDIVSEYYGERVLPKQFIRWNNLEFKLPDVGPSMTKSKRVRVEYFLRVGMYQLFRDEIHVDLPVVIGTAIDPTQQKKEKDPQPIHWPSPVAVSSLTRQDSSQIKQDRLEEIADIFMQMPYTGKRPSVQYISAVARKNRKKRSVDSTPRELLNDDSDGSISDSEKAVISKSADFYENGYYNEADFLSPRSAMSSRRASEVSLHQLSKSASVHFPSGQTPSQSTYTTPRPLQNDKEVFQRSLRKAMSQSCIDRKRPASTSSDKSNGPSQSPKKTTPRNRPTVRKSVSQGTIDMKTAAHIAAGLGTVKRQNALKIRGKKEIENEKSAVDAAKRSQDNQARNVSGQSGSSPVMPPKKLHVNEKSTRSQSMSNGKGEGRKESGAMLRKTLSTGRQPNMSPINSIAGSIQSSPSKALDNADGHANAAFPISGSPNSSSKELSINRKSSARNSSKILSNKQQQLTKARNVSSTKNGMQKSSIKQSSDVSTSKDVDALKQAKTNEERKPLKSGNGGLANTSKKIITKESKKNPLTRTPNEADLKKKDATETFAVAKGVGKRVKKTSSGVQGKNETVTERYGNIEDSNSMRGSSLGGNDTDRMVQCGTYNTKTENSTSISDNNNGDSKGTGTATLNVNIASSAPLGSSVDARSAKGATVSGANMATKASSYDGAKTRSIVTPTAPPDSNLTANASSDGSTDTGSKVALAAPLNANMAASAPLAGSADTSSKVAGTPPLNANMAANAALAGRADTSSKVAGTAPFNASMVANAPLAGSADKRSKVVGTALSNASVASNSSLDGSADARKTMTGTVPPDAKTTIISLDGSVAARHTVVGIAPLNTNSTTEALVVNSVDKRQKTIEGSSFDVISAREATAGNRAGGRDEAIVKYSPYPNAAELVGKYPANIETKDDGSFNAKMEQRAMMQSSAEKRGKDENSKSDGIGKTSRVIARESTKENRGSKTSAEKQIEPNGREISARANSVESAASTTITATKTDKANSHMECTSDASGESHNSGNYSRDDAPSAAVVNEEAISPDVNQENLQESPFMADIGMHEVDNGGIHGASSKNSKDISSWRMQGTVDSGQEFHSGNNVVDEEIVIPAIEQGSVENAPSLGMFEENVIYSGEIDKGTKEDQEDLGRFHVYGTDNANANMKSEGGRNLTNEQPVKEPFLGDYDSKSFENTSRIYIAGGNLVDRAEKTSAEEVDAGRDRALSLDEFELLERAAMTDEHVNAPNQTMSLQNSERRISKIIVVDHSDNTMNTTEGATPLNIEIVVDKKSFQDPNNPSSDRKLYSLIDVNNEDLLQHQKSYDQDGSNNTKPPMVDGNVTVSSNQNILPSSRLTEQQHESSVTRAKQSNSTANKLTKKPSYDVDRNRNKLPEKARKAKLGGADSLEKTQSYQSMSTLNNISTNNPPARRRSVVNIRVVNEQKPVK